MIGKVGGTIERQTVVLSHRLEGGAPAAERWIRPFSLISRGGLGEITAYQDLGIFAKTALGSRDNNEDTIAVFQHKDYTYMVMPDGMGGHSSGEIASDLAANAFRSAILKGMDLADAVKFAHQQIRQIVEADETLQEVGMGTTLSAARIKDNEVTVVHAGDSPIYHVKADGQIRLVALPHINLFNDLKKDISETALKFLPQDIKDIAEEIKSDVVLTHANPPYSEKVIDLLLDFERRIAEVTSEDPALDRYRGCYTGLFSGLGFELGGGSPSVYKIDDFATGDRLIIASDGLNLKTAELKEILKKKIPIDAIVRELIEKRGEDGDNISVMLYEYAELRGDSVVLSMSDSTMELIRMQERITELEEGTRNLQRAKELEAERAAQLEQHNAIISSARDGAVSDRAGLNGVIDTQNRQIADLQAAKDSLQAEKDSLQAELSTRGFVDAMHRTGEVTLSTDDLEQHFLSGSAEKVKEDIKSILRGMTEISPEDKRKIIGRLNQLADEVPELAAPADRAIKILMYLKSGGEEK